MTAWKTTCPEGALRRVHCADSSGRGSTGESCWARKCGEPVVRIALASNRGLEVGVLGSWLRAIMSGNVYKAAL